MSLRDRALIAVCLYSFARIEAALGMDVEDYYPQGKRWWFRLHEKGGKLHEMPAHHKAEEYVDAYIEAAGLEDQKKQPLFRSAIGKTKRLGDRADEPVCGPEDGPAAGEEGRDPHGRSAATASGRPGSRTTSLNGGTLEKAQKMANHESAKTTKLYDRRDDELTLDEVERISI